MSIRQKIKKTKDKFKSIAKKVNKEKYKRTYKKNKISIETTFFESCDFEYCTVHF